MPVYHTLGTMPRKRHTVFKKPGGGIYQEQLVGNEGFTGPASLLYHIYPPTTILRVNRFRETAYQVDPDQTLKHRHFKTAMIKDGGSSHARPGPGPLQRRLRPAVCPAHGQ